MNKETLTNTEAGKLVDSIDWLAVPNDAIAKSICEACGERPTDIGDARGNQWRWQDYSECVQQFKDSMGNYC